MGDDVRFIPPEVELSDPWHYRQVLALNENGERFRQYLPCSGGCGFLIGCGDAVESITHNSCLERAEGSTMPSEQTSIPDTATVRNGGLAGYVVLVFEHGRWKDDWDGEVHPTYEDGQKELRACSNAGYTCILTRCVRVPGSCDHGVTLGLGAAEHCAECGAVIDERAGSGPSREGRDG